MKRFFLVFMVLFLFLLTGLPVFAQFNAGATASAFRYNSAWTVGTEQTQQVPFIYAGVNKNNIFSIGAREVINPGVFNMYGGLINYQPDLTSLFSHTTFNPNQVNISFDVAGGLATLANGNTAPSVEGRVNFQVALTPNASFTGGYAGGGLIGNSEFGTISAGFAYAFGGPMNTKSLARKAFVQNYYMTHLRR